MKKSIFLLAALTIISCSDNELKKDLADNVNMPFTFSAYSNIATKADSHSNLEFFYNTFNVYGWKSLDNKGTWESAPVFNNVTNEYFESNAFGKTIYLENASDPKKPSDEWGNIQSAEHPFPAWYYEGIRFWDKYATNYQFSAYAPITASSQITCTPDGKILIGTSESPIEVDTKNLVATPNKDLAYKGFDKDYMTAKSEAKTSAVSLVFSHELAKFNIKLALSDAVTTDQKVIVKEVSIKHIMDGSYYDSDKESATGYLTGWKSPETEITYSVKGVNGAETGYQMNGETAGTDNFDNYFVMERLMIPQTIQKNTEKNDQLEDMTQACVFVEYTIGDQTYKGHYALANLFLSTNEGTSYDFKGGNEYILTINVGPLPIYFTTQVSPWQENIASDLNAN